MTSKELRTYGLLPAYKPRLTINNCKKLDVHPDAFNMLDVVRANKGKQVLRILHKDFYAFREIITKFKLTFKLEFLDIKHGGFNYKDGLSTIGHYMEMIIHDDYVKVNGVKLVEA